MLTPTKGKRLGSNPAHEKLILNNLVKSLIEHKQVHTTITKAKRLKPYAERIISISKNDNLVNRRRIMGIVNDSTIQHILFTQIATNTNDRNSGWTRIVKTGPRKGDATKMAMVEIILDKKTEELQKAEDEKLKKKAEEISNEKKSDNNNDKSKNKSVNKKIPAEKKSKQANKKTSAKFTTKTSTKKSFRNRTTSK
jgi:large subunit ribosomal protein L17